jgi:Holliday junction resolvase RusA-like endonuclease
VIDLVWHGDPGRVKANSRMAAVTTRKGPRLVRRRDSRSAQDEVSIVLRSQHQGQPLEGPVAIELAVFWPRKHRQGPAKGLALGDVDAPAKAVLDALESAGILADDAQVDHLAITKAVDRDDPRIEIRLSPWLP